MNNANAERLNATPSRSPSDVTRPRKLRRVTRACDYCHKRSTRCKQSQDDNRCQNCVDFDIACTFDRPARKRGSKRQGELLAVEGGSPSGEHANLLLQMMNGHVHDRETYAHGERNGRLADALILFPLASEHRNVVLGNLDKIQDLVDVYFEVVYPM